VWRKVRLAEQGGATSRDVRKVRPPKVARQERLDRRAGTTGISKRGGTSKHHRRKARPSRSVKEGTTGEKQWRGRSGSPGSVDRIGRRDLSPVEEGTTTERV